MLPLNDPVDDLNPVYNLVRWPYNDPADARLRVGGKFLTLRQTDREDAIKIGTFAKKGEAYYAVGERRANTATFAATSKVTPTPTSSRWSGSPAK